ncbi:MAG: hypothetical protein K0R10_1948 [Alphaproteobacteria bacterium]|jgi:hypothetical protein|nr:hypothetical protein [Alphaproteobacteria bacterium]
MSDQKLISNALSLYNRAYYAFHLNTILSVTFNDRGTDINKWINNREPHKEFFDDYRRLMVRTLVIELCVMLEENDRDRRKQYSIYSILKYIKNVAPSKKNFFLREDQIIRADCQYLLKISPALVVPEHNRSKFIAEKLLEEYEAFTVENKSAIEELKNIRDGYLAHPDATHEVKSVQVSHLQVPSEWCFSFVSLILHSLTHSGGRPYVSKERSEFINLTRSSQNSVLNDLLK